MGEFNDVSMDVSDAVEVDNSDTVDWNEFKTAEEFDFLADTAEQSGEEEVSDMAMESEITDDDIKTEAEKAAEYARSCGFDKAAEYIERHYDGDEFVPGNPIPITTRNMALEGTTSENGVPFERRIAELADGLSVEGVFPDFESKHHVELGSAANDMSLHQQFAACRDDFQVHMYDSPEKLEGITFGDMERMDLPQGYTPEGYTWQHNPETGSFDLVKKDDHSVGHTGGNALWGSKAENDKRTDIKNSAVTQANSKCAPQRLERI